MKLSKKKLQESLIGLDKKRYSVTNRGGRLVLTLFDTNDRAKLENSPFEFRRIRSAVEFPDQYLVSIPPERDPETVDSMTEVIQADDSSVHNLDHVETTILSDPEVAPSRTGNPVTAHLSTLDSHRPDQAGCFSPTRKKRFRFAR